MTDFTSTADTLVSQVIPVLGISPCESTQLQSTSTPEDVEEILGTRAFQRYVDTPIHTLDRIVVNQPKCFLPLAQEAKKIAKEIRIKKINEQWCKVLLLLAIQWRSWLFFVCIKLLGNVVRVYPRIVQGLTFLSA